jgi:hypothetical protein
MRSKTQERIEELARQRGAATIDLALVEQGIEIGKQMMAEMIATYSGPPARPEGTTATPPTVADTQRASLDAGGGGYLNEVSALNARAGAGE